MCRAVMPQISAACRHVIFPAIALMITSLRVIDFAFRTTSRAWFFITTIW
jgi:hypothetical protein